MKAEIEEWYWITCFYRERDSMIHRLAVIPIDPKISDGIYRAKNLRKIPGLLRYFEDVNSETKVEVTVRRKPVVFVLVDVQEMSEISPVFLKYDDAVRYMEKQYTEEMEEGTVQVMAKTVIA